MVAIRVANVENPYVIDEESDQKGIIVVNEMGFHFIINAIRHTAEQLNRDIPLKDAIKELIEVISLGGNENGSKQRDQRLN